MKLEGICIQDLPCEFPRYPQWSIESFIDVLGIHLFISAFLNDHGKTVVSLSSLSVWFECHKSFSKFEMDLSHTWTCTWNKQNLKKYYNSTVPSIQHLFTRPTQQRLPIDAYMGDCMWLSMFIAFTCPQMHVITCTSNLQTVMVRLATISCQQYAHDTWKLYLTEYNIPWKILNVLSSPGFRSPMQSLKF